MDEPFIDSYMMQERTKKRNCRNNDDKPRRVLSIRNGADDDDEHQVEQEFLHRWSHIIILFYFASLFLYLFDLTVASQYEQESDLSLDDDKFISLPCVAAALNIVVLIGLLGGWLH